MAGLIFHLKVVFLLIVVPLLAAHDADISMVHLKKGLLGETSESSLRQKRDMSVIGGEPALPKEFPFAARLGYRDNKGHVSWFCGGSLINNQLVLTAAHCTYSDQGSINIVRLGELDFDSDKDDADPEDFGVRGDPIIYPGYEYPAFYNDIAIVRLNRKVIFNEYKRAACLPFEDGRHSRSLVAIGWGQTAFVPRPGEESSKVLQKVTLSNYFNYCQRTAEKSEELPQGYNATTQLCIGSSGHKDTCNGDSGGPALSYHRGSPCGYYLTGITSFGVACDTPGLPGMYTRVYFYVNWIKQEMAKFL